MNPSLLTRLKDRWRAVDIDPYFWLVLAFSLFAILPLAGPDYFFDAHDAPHTAFFLTEFDAAIRDGVWYPGWATDQALGYGYPTFVFYPPLAYYAAEGFHLAGAGKIAALKWTWALGTVGAGWAMYAYARRVMGRRRGLLAAVVYLYMPYHLADIYVRADLAEYASFVWLPLALLAFHNLARGVTARRIGLAGLTYGTLLLTHNVIGLAFTPLLALYALFRLLAERAACWLNAPPGRSGVCGRLGPWGVGCWAWVSLPRCSCPAFWSAAISSRASGYGPVTTMRPTLCSPLISCPPPGDMPPVRRARRAGCRSSWARCPWFWPW